MHQTKMIAIKSVQHIGINVFNKIFLQMHCEINKTRITSDAFFSHALASINNDIFCRYREFSCVNDFELYAMKIHIFC